jgi:plasmid stability protein
MPRTLTLRNVPDGVVFALRERARRNKRSVQRELLSIVTQSVVDRESALAQIAQLRRRHLEKGMTLREIHRAIEEGRP